MANTTSQIRIVFDGVSKGVVAAAAAAKAAIKGLNDENKDLEKVGKGIDKTFAGLTKGLAGLGAAGASVQVIGGVAGALTQLAPAALLLPGALLAGGAAMGTFKIATAGMGDALKAGLSGDLEKFAESTKNMAPAMRDAANAVVAFKPQIDALKKTVQGNFWTGFSGEIQKLGSAYLPVLKTGLGGIATSLGNMGKSLLGTLRQASAVKDVNDILKGTSAFLDNAQFAAAHLAAGFLKIGAAGSQYLSGFGTGLGIATAKFRAWADEVVNSGRIFDWIDGAVQGFKDLGGIVGNVGSILGSLFTGLGGQMSSPLASLRELTGELAAFLKTAEAQDGLRALGEVLATAGQVMRDVLMAALREIAPLLVDLAPAAIALARGVGDFLVGAIQVAGPLLQGLGRFLSENADAVRILTPLVLVAAVAIKGLLLAMEAVAAVKTAAAAITAVGTAAQVAGTKAGLSAAAMGSLKFALLGIAGIVGLGIIANEVDKINVAAAGGDPAKLTGMAENLHDIVGAGKEIASGNFGQIFSEIGAQVAQVGQTWSQGQAPVQQWAAAVGSAISSAASAVGGFFSTLGSTIAGAASSAWNSLVDATSTAFDAVVAFVTGLPARIGAALSSLGSSISAAATGAWQSLVTAAQTAVDSVVAFVTDLPFKVGFALGSLIGIVASLAIQAWTGLVTAAQTAVTATVAFVTGLPAMIGSALSSLASTIVSVATAAWSAFRAAVVNGANAAIAFVRSVPGLIGSALSALGALIVSIASAAWNGFRNAVVTGANAAIAFVRSVPGLIGSALSALGSLIVAVATSAWNSFRNAVVAGVNATVAFVRGIPGQITAALGNLGGLLLNAGRAIIDGLLAGLRAGVGALYSFVSGIAAGIAAHKGPLPYDRRLLVPAGLAIMEGLSAGLRSGYADVLAFASSAAAGIADQLSTTVSPTLSMATPSLALSAPDTTAAALQQLLAVQSGSAPIEVTVLLDGQPVRDIARTEIATTSRATRRVVLAGAGTTF